jgi:hypothetical protein
MIMSQLEYYKRTRQLRIVALTQWTVDNDVSNARAIADEAQKRFKVSRSTANSYTNEVVNRLNKLKLQRFYCSI